MNAHGSDLTGNLLAIFLRIMIPSHMIQFAWGAGDPPGLMIAKRTFLLLPVLSMIMGLWSSLLGGISVIVRQGRSEFITAIVITWWDLGKSILNFWGGVFKFVFYLFASLVGLLKFLAVGIWVIIQDFLLLPFRLVGSLAGSVLKPGIPWIAVTLTLLWCGLEAVIFTYVMSPLVIDTFSNLTGEQMGDSFVRVPLFFFMMFIILGSYAVLANLASAIRSKDVAAIAKILMIEIVALFVEVVFLYREFVDSLVPWFAQYTSENFKIGISGILAIAGGMWLGIRGLSWFLFANHGTPTIMAIIQGAGIQSKEAHAGITAPSLDLTSTFTNKIRAEVQWMQKKGEDLLGSFVLPPLQVIAAAVNFCILLITGQHLFTLPFKTLDEIIDSKSLIASLSRTGRPKVRERSPAAVHPLGGAQS